MHQRHRPFLFLAMLSAVATSYAAEVSLDEALRLAKERNGTVVAAYLNLLGAQSAVRQAKGSYLPTVTPRLTWDEVRNEQFTGTSINSSRSGSTVDVSASWRLLDNGQRQYTLASSRASATAEEASALLTLRNKLFEVTQNYYDALRAVELLRVQQAQFERTDLILKQTRARAEVGDIAKKDILQAEADQLNSRVSVLGAQNRVKTSLTSLKANIGWSEADGSLELIAQPAPNLKAFELKLDEAIAQALERRPDLLASRRQLDAQRYSVKLAKADAGLDYTVDATFVRSFARDVSNRSGLGLVVSFPLFDGNRTKEIVRQRELSYDASKARLVQSERDVRGTVEQAYVTYETNLLRLEASQAALAAARKNFEAASRSQALGAASLVEVVQAQASLVTAEVNAVEAIYDALISEAQLRLAIGDPVRGE